MKLLALALVALLLLAVSCEARSVPPPQTKAERATHTLTQEGTGKIFCTAVAISRYVLLTATHCTEQLAITDVDGKPTVLTRLDDDGHDNTMLRSDRPFPHVARVGKHPQVTDRVFVYGHAQGVPHALYREGYMVGKVPDDRGTWNMWDMELYKGDSGSGIWNARGELVATTSELHFSYDSLYRLVATRSYHFTAGQVKRAGIRYGKYLTKYEA